MSFYLTLYLKFLIYPKGAGKLNLSQLFNAGWENLVFHVIAGFHGGDVVGQNDDIALSIGQYSSISWKLHHIMHNISYIFKVRCLRCFVFVLWSQVI